MRILIQRASEAEVRVGGETVGSISKGLVAFIGIRESDTLREIEWMVQKLLNLRIFEDNEGKMNLSLLEVGGCVLAVSQFTLYADTQKGNRPNFMRAARPEIAEPLYETFLERLRVVIGEANVESGIFQAEMEVDLVNDGPVTIILERESGQPEMERIE